MDLNKIARMAIAESFRTAGWREWEKVPIVCAGLSPAGDLVAVTADGTSAAVCKFHNDIRKSCRVRPSCKVFLGHMCVVPPDEVGVGSTEWALAEYMRMLAEN